MSEPMMLDTLKLASTAGLGSWLATQQRSPAEVRHVKYCVSCSSSLSVLPAHNWLGPAVPNASCPPDAAHAGALCKHT